MLDPNFPLNAFLDVYTDRNKFDNIDDYASLASFPSLGVVEKLYRAIDTNITYRWDGATYVIYSASATDVITSASNVGTGVGIYHQEVANNLQLRSITGTAGYVNIQNTVPTEVNIDLQTQTKNKIDNSIQDVSSTNANLLSVAIDGNRNVTLTPQIGGGEPLLFTYSTAGGPNPASGQIKITSAGDFSVATQMIISYSALNRSDNNFIKTYLRTMGDNNIEFLLLNDGDVNDYVCFHVLSIGTVGAQYITFNIEYDAGGSTALSFTSPLNVKLFIAYLDRIPVSVNTNLLTVTNTDTTSTISNLVGSHQPPILLINVTPADNHFTTDNNADFTLITQVYIGVNPYNVRSGFFNSFLDNLQNHSLPLRLKIVETSNSANYASFTLHTSNGSTGSYYQFLATYDATTSTITTSSGSVHLVFTHKQRTLTAGENISITSSANNETLTINTQQKSTLQYSDVVNYIYTGGEVVNNSTTITANGSLDIIVSSTTQLGVYDTLNTFRGNGFPRRVVSSLSSTPRNSYFAVKLIGTGWGSSDVGNIPIGWVTEQWLENIETRFISNASVYALYWDVSTSSAIKGFTMSFSGTEGRMNYDGVSFNTANRTGTNTTDSISAQNDVLVIGHVNGVGMRLHWYRGGSQISICSTGLPSGGLASNFYGSNIIPVIACANQGTTWGFRVMSHREMIADGLTDITNNFIPYFF